MKTEKMQLDTKIVKQFGEYIQSLPNFNDLTSPRRENLIKNIINIVCNDKPIISYAEFKRKDNKWIKLNDEDEWNCKDIQWIKDNLDLWDIEKSTLEALTRIESFTFKEKKTSKDEQQKKKTKKKKINPQPNQL